ncbi:MAG: nucleotidyltransferase family protein, partial [Clostridia bacterium]|nr:nucleotidyltransferase family protein [Clostridia bacterium]
FRKGEVHVEMHKRLTDDSDEIQSWECEMWNRAVPVKGNIFRMSPEDYYIFHFVHLHKDFMNGSLGLRRIVDTWLLQKRGRDMEYVRKKLEGFGMWAFHERMVALSHAAMGDGPIDENCEIMLSHAFKHGIYGTEVSYKTGRIAAMGKDLNSGKRKSAIAAVFLPYKRMKAQFPILEKWPILLPWCWLRRIVRFLRGNTKKSREMLDYSRIDEQDFEEMKRFFEAGGVR